ncbi:MAG: TIGR01212 family radical SAM protein [bacterium]|nr:TIGR01212 family radical SAM protein [bacterium]
MLTRYNKFSDYLKHRFSSQVRKLPLDLGLTCPNRDGTLSVGGCIYCDEKGSGTGKKRYSIEEQVERGLEELQRKGVNKVIGYFQSFSNTYCSPEFLEKNLNLLLKYPEIVLIYLGTRPDAVTEGHLKVLEKVNKRKELGIEYGLQSSNDNTLNLINRQHTLKDFIDAVNLTKKFKLFITAHIIIGLPGETEQDNIITARTLSSLPIDSVKIHQLYIVRDTRLELLYLTGEFIPIRFDDSVKNTVSTLRNLRRDIIIQRLTGDPKPGQLVAPEWINDKSNFISAVENLLEEFGAFQGDRI